MSHEIAPPIQPASSRQDKTVWIHAERRAKVRYHSEQFAYLSYRPEADATYQTVRIWNVTDDDLGLFLHRPIQVGTAYYLQFQHPVVQDRVAVAVHVTQQTDHWLVGCALNHPLNADELRALTA